MTDQVWNRTGARTDLLLDLLGGPNQTPRPKQVRLDPLEMLEGRGREIGAWRLRMRPQKKRVFPTERLLEYNFKNAFAYHEYYEQSRVIQTASLKVARPRQK